MNVVSIASYYNSFTEFTILFGNSFGRGQDSNKVVSKLLKKLKILHYSMRRICAMESIMRTNTNQNEHD